MPNLNEFFNRSEILHKEGLEKINGTKPCAKCDKDAEEAFWDSNTLTMTWKCPEGHDNQYRVQ
jgi:hypothetical protein